MRFVEGIIFVLFFAIVGIGGAGVMPIEATPAGDGFYSQKGNSYDGASAGLQCSCSLIGKKQNTQLCTGYIEFALEKLLSDSSVESVFLNLYVNSAEDSSGLGSAGSVWHVTDSHAANGDASERMDGDVKVAEIGVPAGGWLSLDVTEAVRSDILNGYSYACFSLNPNCSGKSSFEAVSADTGLNAPSLSTAVVPEPACVMLLLLGAGVSLVAHRI